MNDSKSVLKEHLEKMKDIQKLLLNFLDNENAGDCKSLINNFIQAKKICANKYELKAFLYLLSVISTYHNRSINFYCKIESIIKAITKDIKSNFSNIDIFHIFIYNKRLLMFLFQEKIIVPDKEISQIISKEQYTKMFYPHYFFTEFKSFFEEDLQKKIESSLQKHLFPKSEIFDQKRKIGQNDNCICQLIRDDSVTEFIEYVKKNNINFNEPINQSIFETNYFLLNQNTTLINYAAFFGSLHILQYLLKNNVKTTKTLWLYSVHSNNIEIIHQLEENNVEKDEKTYDEMLIESIKSHNFIIYSYIKKLVNKDMDMKNDEFFFNNYEIIQSNDYFSNKSLSNYIFYKCCQFDYIFIVQCMINDISINSLIEDITFDVINEEDEETLKETSKETALHAAVQNNNLEIVKLLLCINGIDINIKTCNISVFECRKDKYFDKDGKRMLNYDYINTFTIEGKGQNINEEEKTPLYLAIENDNYEIVQLLLNRNEIDINAKSLIKSKFFDSSTDTEIQYSDTEEKTALNIAVEQSNLKIIKLLLAQQAIDINAKLHCETFEFNEQTKSEKTVLHVAVINNNTEIIHLLMCHPKIDINSQFCSIKYKQNSLDKTKMEKSDIEEKHALHFAAENGNLEIVQLLLTRQDIDINARSHKESIDFTDSINEIKTALHIAIENNHSEIVKILLSQKNIDPNIKLLVNGTYEEDYDDFLSYTKKYEHEKTPLYVAVTNDNLEICKNLLNSQKTDVNSKSQIYGKTELAFFEAIERSNYKIVELFLNRKDLNINIQKQEKENNYQTALLLAIEKGNYEIVKILLTRKDLDINIQIQERENYNKTALFQAIYSNNSKIMKLLLSRKDLDINAKVKSGKDNYKRALYLAIEEFNVKFITLLLNREDLIDEFNVIPSLCLKYTSIMGKAYFLCYQKAKLISDGLLPNIQNIYNLSRKNAVIYLGFQKVYHATTLEAAQSIMNENSLRIGTKGMFGAGIYFASKAKIAKKKVAHSNTKAEAYIKCDVDFGYSLVLHKPNHSITLKELNKLGCDSVLGRSSEGKKWEYVVYESSRTFPKSLKIFKDE